MNRRHHSRLWLYFAGIVFATVCAVFLLISISWFALYKMHFISIDPRSRHAPLLLFSLGSLLLGSVIAIFVGKLIVRPVQKIENAFDALSKGDFNVRIPENDRIWEIREMARHFNAMAYDLSHIETLRSDFVANVSHEFKTPIAAIEGYATLLQNHRLPKERHDHYVERILDNSHRLSNMSENILLLSRLENQETIPAQSDYRLDEQIRQCVLMLENKWTLREIVWEIDLPRQRYHGSRGLLDQVWINLLDNAIKHSPEGGCICIRLTAENDMIHVSIADHGDGMEAEVQKHIFEKFYQGERSHSGEGNGLGLALVKRILELCHGAISVDSAPGAGATFTVSLPDNG